MRLTPDDRQWIANAAVGIASSHYKPESSPERTMIVGRIIINFVELALVDSDKDLDDIDVYTVSFEALVAAGYDVSDLAKGKQHV